MGMPEIWGWQQFTSKKNQLSIDNSIPPLSHPSPHLPYFSFPKGGCRINFIVGPVRTMSDIPIKKSYEEINSKIKRGEAVVVTAEEMVGIVKSEGPRGAFKKVDVVTTGTFGTMCSSGAFINFGHTKPAHEGVARSGSTTWRPTAASPPWTVYLGATQVPDDDPLNKVHPGRVPLRRRARHRGPHRGKQTSSSTAKGYGTDCYPLQEVRERRQPQGPQRTPFSTIRATPTRTTTARSTSPKETIYTYMGMLKPDLGNANLLQRRAALAAPERPLSTGPSAPARRSSSAAPWAPSAWQGTQHAPASHRGDNGVPREGAGTIAVTGDMKEMAPEFIRGASFTGLRRARSCVGLGHSHPDPQRGHLRYFTGVSDEDIFCQVVDYGNGLSRRRCRRRLGEVSYAS